MTKGRSVTFKEKVEIVEFCIKNGKVYAENRDTIFDLWQLCELNRSSY